MNKLLVICGATATGKTALAVRCAKRLNGEIVSCDSMLVYRGLDVGTAKPTVSEREGIFHHLIDIVEPTENFSVSDFQERAISAVEAIHSRGKTPILTGGTGFYLSSVLFRNTYGNTPSSPAIREKYERIAEIEGAEGLHKRLQSVDPESAEKLHKNDVKRVIRALEIYELTGRKKSEQTPALFSAYPYVAVAVDFPREELYSRIDRRVDEMFNHGLIEEVKGLLARGVPENAQCMQGIGYKEVVECLKNGDKESTMSDIIKKNTRNYAKRQLTFFKKFPNLVWLSAKDLTALTEETLSIYGH